MSFKTQLRDYVDARATGIWIRSDDHDDALLAISQTCEESGFRLLTWDADRQVMVQQVSSPQAGRHTEPLPTVLRQLHTELPPPDVRPADSPNAVLFVLRNFHKMIGNAEISAIVANQLQTGKHYGSFVVVLSSLRPGDPQVGLTADLQNLFVLLEHPLPNRSELLTVANGLLPEPLQDAEADAVADAASGLTYQQAELAYSLSMVQNSQRIVPEAIWNHKAQILEKSEALTLYRGNERFSDLGGLEGLKSFCLRALSRKPASHDSRPLGVLLVGPAGTGKSQFCKTLGNEVRRPAVRMDCGALRGRYQGQTEERTRGMLNIVDAMGSIVLFLDEIEKALSGTESSGATEGGTGARLMGSLLTWMNDRTSDAFIVASCNSVEGLPAPFTRAERFDAIFFLDLPTDEEKQQIWKIYLHKFQLDQRDEKTLLSLSQSWTGAEIRACCRLAAVLGISLEEAATFVIPTAVTGKEELEKLHRWATGRCLSARTGKRYEPTNTANGAGVISGTRQRRSISKGSS